MSQIMAYLGVRKMFNLIKFQSFLEKGKGLCVTEKKIFHKNFTQRVLCPIWCEKNYEKYEGT